MPIINPQTGQAFAENINPFTGETVDSATAKMFQQDYAASAKPQIIPKADSPISSSTEVRNNVNDVKNQATDLVNTVNNLDNLGGTLSDIEKAYKAATEGNTKIQTQFDELNNVRKSLGILTAGEEADVTRAGELAAAEFVPLINEATESKRKGMPVATIAAGERGGFMSTQMAGAAALAPTQGGTFVGAGGELENIKSVYDNNIANVKAKQLQAKNAAMAAAKQAILTGKSADFNAAKSLLDTARLLNTDALNLANEKVTAISNYQNLVQAKTKYNLDIAGKSAFSALTGDDTTDKQTIADLAKTYNLDANLLKGVVQDLKNEKTTADLEVVQKKYNIAKDIPKGQTYKDPDTGMIFIGTKEGEKMDVVETVGGTEYKVRYDLSDPSKPKELFRIVLGPRWKGGGDDSGKDTTIDEALIQTAEYLNGLKSTGQFNDITYNVAINSLASEYGIADIEALKGNINSKLGALEGKSTTSNQTGGQTSGENQLNYVTNKELFPGFSVPMPTKAGLTAVTTAIDPFAGKNIYSPSQFGQSSTPGIVI